MNDYENIADLLKEIERRILGMAELAIHEDRVFQAFRKQCLDLLGHTFALKRLKEIFREDGKENP